MDLRNILDATDFYSNFTAALSTFSLDHLDSPTLNLQIIIQEGNSADGDRSGSLETNEEPILQSGHLLLSVRALIDYDANSRHEILSERNFY